MDTQDPIQPQREKHPLPRQELVVFLDRSAAHLVRQPDPLVQEPAQVHQKPAARRRASTSAKRCSNSNMRTARWSWSLDPCSMLTISTNRSSVSFSWPPIE